MSKLNLNAEDALAEVRALITEIKNLKTQIKKIRNNNSDTFKKLEESSDILKSKVALLGNKLNLLSSILKKQSNEINKLKRDLDKTNRSVEKNTKATDKNTKSTKQNTTSKKRNAKANKSLSLGLNSLIKSFGIIGGIRLFVDTVKDTFNQIVVFDSLRFTMESITQTNWDYAQSQEFLIGLTQKYGVELVSTSNRWLKFLAAAKQAGLSLRSTERIFESMTKAAATLGLKTDEVASIYLALEQMLSKGKVSTEELRRQLGERLPGAMGIMAAAIGVTTSELDKMLRKGEVLSAEVLPKFAEAVEVAFGIQNVEKVETLRSKIGRLAATWQIFISNISESEGPLIQSLTNILDKVNEVLYNATFYFSDEKQKLRLEVVDITPEIEKKLEKQANKIVEKTLGLNNVLENLEKERLENLEKQARATDKIQLESLKNRYDEIISETVNFNSLVQKQLKKDAAIGLPFLQSNLNEFKDDLNQDINTLRILKENLDRIQETGTIGISSEDRKNFPKAVKVLEDLLKVGKFKRISAIENEIERTESLVVSSRLLTAELQAEFNVRKKLLEVDRTESLNDDSDDDKKPRIKNLKEILDLEKQIQIEIANRIIEENKSKIDSKSLNNSDRIKLEKENNKLLNRITELQFQIEIDNIRKKEKEKNQALDKLLRDKVKIIGDVNKQREDIEKEANQKIEIAEQKRNKQIILNQKTFDSQLLSIIEKTNKDKIDIIKQPFNIEISRIKSVFESSKKTKKDQIKLEKDLKKLAIESLNAQIDAQIELLRAEILVTEYSEETINALIRKINELQAAKKNYVENPDENDGLKFWEVTLDLASDFSNSLGDLLDSIYERRLSNIDKEINAEEKKYDKLIELAENDEIQQNNLRKAREARITELEAKRLKEEQKQAKIRKAFAVADIAVSTAQAIMRAYADTGPIAGNVFAAIIGAIGALQIAAVLAEPIPQFKDGGESKKDQVGLINDGGKQEYIKRGNNILTNKNKNALVNLKKGDYIYKNYDEMSKNNKQFLATGNKINHIDNINYNLMYNKIKDGVKDGMKGTKFKNNINLINKQDNYRNYVSRWSN